MSEKRNPAEVLQGKRVLLCEDHPINAELTCRLIESTGCSIDVAEDGKKGLDAFSNAPLYYYAAVLMDIQMPVMDGLEAARRIRALDRIDAKRVPIIATTGNGFEEDIRKTKAAGMNAHLVKPISPITLFETLAELILEDSAE